MAGVLTDHTRFAKAGTFMGMPRIVETGLCEDDSTSRNALDDYETGRVQIEPLPRTAGLTVKALDGQTITLKSFTSEDTIGSVANCLQLGKTEYYEFAPSQPFGSYSGSRILRWRRVWVQMESS